MEYYYQNQLNRISFHGEFKATVRFRDVENSTHFFDVNKESAAVIVKKLVDEFDLNMYPEFKYPKSLVDAYKATSTDDPQGSDIIESYGTWLEHQLQSRIKYIDKIWAVFGNFCKSINELQ